MRKKYLNEIIWPAISITIFIVMIFLLPTQLISLLALAAIFLFALPGILISPFTHNNSGTVLPYLPVIIGWWIAIFSAMIYFCYRRGWLWKLRYLPLILAIVIGCSIYKLRWQGYVVKKIDSPKHHYYIEVVKLPLLFAMPGGGSDWDGYVRLRDRNGKLLGEEYFPLYSVIDEPQWTDSGVSIKLVADWKFPEKDQ